MNPHNTHPQTPAPGAIVPAVAEHPVPAPIPLARAVSSEASDLTLPVLKNAIERVEESLVDFQELLDMTTNMTGRERLRLFGVKSRNYGFISKAYAIALENPNFRPANFSFDDMTNNIEVLDQSRQLSMVLDQLRMIAEDLLLLSADNSYRDALRVYGNLREQSRANVAGARSLFLELLQFFTLHRGGRTNEQPTEKQLEIDFHRLIHGHADGEMVIKNESPHLSRAVHEVVDEVHKHGKGGAEIEVKE